MQKTAWDMLGPVRNEKKISQAQEKIKEISKMQMSIENPIEILLALEMRGLIDTAESVAEDALRRKVSLGTHFREDS